MFNNNKRGRDNKANAITVIAKGSLIEGTLRVTGTVQIDGTVQGTLVAGGHVLVGPEGHIAGDLEAEALSLSGSIEGTVLVRGNMHVLTTGRLQGEARYDSLEIDRGGVMAGRTSQLHEEVEQIADNDIEVIVAKERDQFLAQRRSKVSSGPALQVAMIAVPEAE